MTRRSRLGCAYRGAGARRLLRDAAQSGRAAAAGGEARWPNLSGAHLAVRPGRRRLEPAHAEVRGQVQLRLDAGRPAGGAAAGEGDSAQFVSVDGAKIETVAKAPNDTPILDWAPGGSFAIGSGRSRKPGSISCAGAGCGTACPARRFPPRRPTSGVRESRPTVGTWRTSRTRAAARRSISHGCQRRPASGRSHSRGPTRVALHLPGAARGRTSSLHRGHAAVGSCGHRAGAAARQTEHGAGSTGQHQRDRSGARRAAAAAVLRPVNRCAAHLGENWTARSWSAPELQPLASL